MATASSNPFMLHLTTNVIEKSSANVINFSRTITYVETLAERLKRLRKALKLSQAKLAEKAGVSQSAIGMIESGERENPQILVPLAAALGVTAEMLATGRGVEQQRVMADHEAELIDQWGLLSPSQQTDLQRSIRHHIEHNKEVLEAFGSKRQLKRDPQIIDTTLPDPNEFSDFAEQRRHERRMAKTQIDIDRRAKDRREK